MTKITFDKQMNRMDYQKGVRVYKQKFGSIMDLYVHNNTPELKWAWTICTSERLVSKSVFETPQTAYQSAKSHVRVLLRDAQYDLLYDE